MPTLTFTVAADTVDLISGPYGTGPFKVSLLGGNDRLFAADTNDTVLGGVGNDTIDLRFGNDVANGGGGNDLIFGGGGNDVLRGDAGNDTLYGDEGNDGLIGGSGKDLIHAGVGVEDFVDAGIGDDKVVIEGAGYVYGFMGAGNDTVDASYRATGDHSFQLDAGNDVYVDGKGNDTITGGDGADAFCFNDVRADYRPGGDNLVVDLDFSEGDTLVVPGYDPYGPRPPISTADDLNGLYEILAAEGSASLDGEDVLLAVNHANIRLAGLADLIA